MQPYKIIPITRDEIVPLAERMRKEGRILTMIHGYYNVQKEPVVSYDYQVDDGVESYQVKNESSLPSIVPVYDMAAKWPELEIMELMDITFEGLKKERLFLPDTMFDGQGQILVTPMEELIKKNHGGEE